MIRNLLYGLVFFCLPLGVASAESPAILPSWQQSQAGMLLDPVLNEVSGLASSRCVPGRLWVLNDSGNKPELYAISEKGELLATLSIEGTKNVDWEDMASFRMNGKNYILIGDMGDNRGWRGDCVLYLIEEPETLEPRGKVKPLAVIPFSYEDGPRDVESLAVDVAGKKILLLSKREKITALYELPLVLQSPAFALTAKKIASMDAMPLPSEEDRKANPGMAPYLAQPTAMDISADDLRLVVLTYQDVFLYQRKPDESWAEAVLRKPHILARHHMIQAEAACFTTDGNVIFVTGERKLTVPMFRYDLKK